MYKTKPASKCTKGGHGGQYYRYVRVSRARAGNRRWLRKNLKLYLENAEVGLATIVIVWFTGSLVDWLLPRRLEDSQQRNWIRMSWSGINCCLKKSTYTIWNWIFSDEDLEEYPEEEPSSPSVYSLVVSDVESEGDARTYDHGSDGNS
ncbi:hypothetical protein DPV78_006265 [Talaromyces pinophilus]|nr:hypothetical protein DPV78_006265 [Talaromyces pinophilus]